MLPCVVYQQTVRDSEHYEDTVFGVHIMPHEPQHPHPTLENITQELSMMYYMFSNA